jgi:hypothetical protein
MWLGRTDTTQNRSVAEVSILPTLREWASYQLLWRRVFADMYEFVLHMAEKYGGQEFDDKTCEVTMDAPLDAEIGVVAPLVIQMASAKLIAPQDAARLLLQRRELGVADVEAAVMAAFPPEPQPAGQTTQPAPTTVKGAREAQAQQTLVDLFRLAYQDAPSPELREDARRAAEVAITRLGESV